MNPKHATNGLMCMVLIIVTSENLCDAMSHKEKRYLREKVLEMFNHAYRNYMDHAYPADELMPLSCKGRYRGTLPGRGDIDDALGNFSLTLVDTLDSLVVLGQLDAFDEAVRLVIRDVTFDRDVVVSVFETNIRMLGGLLGGHVMAIALKKKKLGMQWYDDELLEKAKDLGQRLLPAFNTSTGIPYPRVNLRYGVHHHADRTRHAKDTCTACAGTMILEFAALSRLTGEPIYEEKAHRAMEYLWMSRHRASDLVGTVINIHSGDWVRRESGVGAGIDSYYEYMFKAYVLLGDETYLDRFNKHYAAVMKYINQGPLLVDVHMHKPLRNSRNFMDSLLAFWPGLQVLKGDIKPAIEIHEMLYQVTQLHNFLPEAFTTDFRVHWGQHPLRPEFVESTYFIYKATGDPYYLEVGKTVVENLDRYGRVPCGFAAIKDVKTNAHEDQMDSFVMAETFKYLYLLFSEKTDIVIDLDEYIFTTEAHLLPLSLSLYSYKASGNATTSKAGSSTSYRGGDEDRSPFDRSCPNDQTLFRRNIHFGHSVRSPVRSMVQNRCPRRKPRSAPKLRAVDFIAGSAEQVQHLNRMGIRIITMNDGRVQLLHTATEASSTEDAEDGMVFMQEMIELSRAQSTESQQEPRVIQFISAPYLGSTVLEAGPAQFGYDLKTKPWIEGEVIEAVPLQACTPLSNAAYVRGKIAIMERGGCMFVDKARQLEAAGAIGGIVIDSSEGTTAATSPLFAMSGDGGADVEIPVVFLFHAEAQVLRSALSQNQAALHVLLAYKRQKPEEVLKAALACRLADGAPPPDFTTVTRLTPLEPPRYVVQLPTVTLELTADLCKAADRTGSQAVMFITRGPAGGATVHLGAEGVAAWSAAVFNEISTLLADVDDYTTLRLPRSAARLAALGRLVGVSFRGAKLDAQLQGLLDRGLPTADPQRAALLGRVNRVLAKYGRADRGQGGMGGVGEEGGKGGEGEEAGRGGSEERPAGGQAGKGGVVGEERDEGSERDVGGRMGREDGGREEGEGRVGEESVREAAGREEGGGVEDENEEEDEEEDEEEEEEESVEETAEREEDGGGAQRRYDTPTLHVAPADMKLEAGEIFVDGSGKVYSGEAESGEGGEDVGAEDGSSEEESASQKAAMYGTLRRNIGTQQKYLREQPVATSGGGGEDYEEQREQTGRTGTAEGRTDSEGHVRTTQRSAGEL